MRLVVRELSLPPDPLELARRLADRPGLALLLSADGSGPSFIACDPADSAHALDPEPELELSVRGGDLGRVPRWIGLLPYEARRQALERPSLTRSPDLRPEPHLSGPVWWRYNAAARVTDRVCVIGESARAVDALASLLERRARVGSVALRPLGEPEPDMVHLRRIERALELIAAGEVYQVNLARRLLVEVEGHPLDLLAPLAEATRAPYAAALRATDFDLISTSPELFLELSADRRVRTTPIKGTRPRSQDRLEDEALARELDADGKERAELAMVLDVERNDLGRIARTGSVELLHGPHVSGHPTLYHRAATLGAELRPDVDRTRLLEAMLPSGSVTGAPKVRAMELIARLEAQRRGLYTGAFGALCQDGGLVLAMAIRTLSVKDGEGHYHVGGGIVADSHPRRELEETRWKAVQLESLLLRSAVVGGPPENWPARALRQYP